MILVEIGNLRYTAGHTHPRTHTHTVTVYHTRVLKIITLIKQRRGDGIKQAKRVRTLGLDRALKVQTKMKRKIVH
jgi:hypothetical protein